MKKVSLAIPVYFEEEVITQFIEKTEEELKKLPYEYEFIFVDDGSKDNTVTLIKELAQSRPYIKLVVLSYNQGKAVAATTAFEYAEGDYVVYMDPDLQDPPEKIGDFVQKLEEGYDLVWGIRKEKKDSFFNTINSKIFWWTLNKFTGLEIPKGIAVMRAFSQPFRNNLLKYKERNRFLEGLFYKVGGKTTSIEIEQRERFAGESKFNFKRRMNLAFDAIFDYSSLPLQMSIQLGILLTIGAFLFILILLLLKLLVDFQSGWVSITSLILLSVGVQLLSIGILSNYIGRIYTEVKERPLQSIKEKININNE